MGSFKVICKADGKHWEGNFGTKIVTIKSFFGLIKNTVVEKDLRGTPGPSKDEICIVYREHETNGVIFYMLEGYPTGAYDSQWFIKLDEFTETQKEIAEKSEQILN